jgi:uncharacterized lipoprotein YehR (DUF1307 family)
MKRNFILFLFMISACFMLYGCSNSSSSTEEYVGEVNGIKITQAEYDERYVLMQNSYKIQQAYSGTEVEELPAEVLENIQAQTLDSATARTKYTHHQFGNRCFTSSIGTGYRIDLTFFK